MSILKKLKEIEYAYIQPTFFDDAVDVVCYWRAGRSKVESSLIMCSSMEQAIETMDRIK